MTNIRPKIWVLVDNKTGNANQAIELAGELGEEFKIKHIEYNSFARLPNSLLSLFPIHVKKSSLLQLKNDQLPDLIISSGRRTATVALHLKKISNNKIKIIQIMRPNLDAKEFELIILPQHDSFNHTLSNVVRIIGALTNVEGRLSRIKGNFEANYPNLRQFIAVIIGGSTKKYNFTLQNAELLAGILSSVVKNHSLPLFITFSRRTPKDIKKYFQQRFPHPNIIYDPLDGGDNPYPAIIQKAEYIVSTPDSISMCSEAAGTGKPVYVFCPENFRLKKHNFFIQQLVDLGIVRRLEETTNCLEKYEYEPLSEITKVVDIIKDRILQEK